MEFRVLGAIELRADGKPVDIGPPRQRAVLAALSVDVGRPVLADTMIDRVWGQEPPDGVRHGLHVYVARIRRVLRIADPSLSTTVVRRSGGYVLDVDPDRVDMHRFARLVRQSRDRAGTDHERVTLLRQAMQLWRGAPLADLPGLWVSQVRQNLVQQRLDTAVAWAQAEVAVGDAAATIPTLTELVGEHPLVETIVAALMRAHHATGNTDEALTCYTSLRQRLIEALGVEPGAEVKALHQTVLRGDEQPVTLRDHHVPAQLPLDVHGFTGRSGELAALDALLTSARAEPTAVVVSVVSGTAGVGKTALTVHWAHRVRSSFPDGQLYVDLRGFTPDGGVSSPDEVIRGFLDALGVPPHRVPVTLEAQTALYRSLLTGRRMLVLLDNARDARQVRPLLPGSPGCLVLVTSRRQLPGLVAAHGARPLILDLPSPAEARAMMTRRLGAADPGILDEIIALCARLPLALSIAAARAATHPNVPLETLAAELRSTSGSLAAFAGDDEVTDVRAALSWSYRALSPDAAALFRQLGLHPGPDVSVAAAASLGGTSVAQAHRLLTELTDAHLATEQTLGRYALHDLLRAYAIEQAHSIDGEADRQAALLRMLDHYLHTAHAAARLLSPDRAPIAIDPPRAGVVLVDIANHDHALSWYASEYSVLLAAVTCAGTGRFDTHATQLAWSLTTFLDRRGLWHDRLVVQLSALAAADRLGDRPGQAHIHRGLANAYARLGRYEDSRAHLGQALNILDELAEYAGQANTHMTLGFVCELEGRHAEALGHAEKALELCRTVGHPTWQARALNEVGWRHAMLGHHRQALVICRQALAELRHLGDRNGEAGSWDSLGYAHQHLGDHDQAVSCYRQALRLLADLGDHTHEAEVLVRLAETLDGAGVEDEARAARESALAIFERIGHPDAKAVRARLEGRPVAGCRP